MRARLLVAAREVVHHWLTASPSSQDIASRIDIRDISEGFKVVFLLPSLQLRVRLYFEQEKAVVESEVQGHRFFLDTAAEVMLFAQTLLLVNAVMHEIEIALAGEGFTRKSLPALERML